MHVQNGAEDDEEHEEEEAEREEGVLRALDGEVHDFDGSVLALVRVDAGEMGGSAQHDGVVRPESAEDT